MKNEKLILKYVKAIHNFEEDLNTIYRVKNKSNLKGYLIKLKDLENLKKTLNYDEKVKKMTNLGFVVLNGSEKIFTIEDIKIKTPEYLLNMIYFDNSYIIISQELWKILCEKGKESEPPILYSINSDKITVQLDKLELTFKQTKNKNNIIDKNNYDST